MRTISASTRVFPAPGALRTDLLLERGVAPRDSRIVASSWQDVEPILARNALLRGAPQQSDFARHVASIPAVILVRWANESGLRLFTAEFNELVAKKLRDPDWAYLRVDK